MQMDDTTILIPFISLLNSVLLTDKPLSKFILKYDIQNYFRNFTKNVSEKLNFQWNKTQAVLVM